jgi:hypothetical protein
MQSVIHLRQGVQSNSDDDVDDLQSFDRSEEENPSTSTEYFSFILSSISRKHRHLVDDAPFLGGFQGGYHFAIITDLSPLFH